MKKTVYLSVIVLALAIFSTHYTSARFSLNDTDDTRMLRKVKWGPEPIELTELRLNGKQIILDQPFVAGEENWVSDLRFKVMNRSNKPILFMRFELQFPLKGGPRPAFYVEAIEFGKKTGAHERPETLGPGETIELTCKTDVASLKQWLRDLGRPGYSNMRVALLSTEIVNFADKTSWTAGEWLRFDSHDNKWIEMNLVAPDKTDEALAIFQPAVYKSIQGEACWKNTHDVIDCQSECECGTRHDITIPSADPGPTSKEADKIQVCCTQNGFQCVVAYTGVAPCN